ncbi:SGNH/GDSL hydrolase family protein [Paraburkholderia caffeinilytica]|uniref:hypothetical protein n=1 Tax=Paraburkholderia caffeinilytica TaxID=1761016 RepID=UPI0038B79312
MMTVSQQTEPDVSQAILQAQLDDTGITIANHATGGTSSSLQNEMLGVDGNGAPFAQRVALSKASIVIDNHAMNDALGGETLDDYKQYLPQWIAAVRAAGKTPVLEEPNPVCDGNHPQLGDYVQAMEDAAFTYGVALITQYAYLQTVPNYCSHLNAGFYPDDAIYAIKAQRQAAALAPLVQAIIGSQS